MAKNATFSSRRAGIITMEERSGFLLDAQGSGICLATVMHYEDVNIKDDGVRLT